MDLAERFGPKRPQKNKKISDAEIAALAREYKIEDAAALRTLINTVASLYVKGISTESSLDEKQRGKVEKLQSKLKALATVSTDTDQTVLWLAAHAAGLESEKNEDAFSEYFTFLADGLAKVRQMDRLLTEVHEKALKKSRGGQANKSRAYTAALIAHYWEKTLGRKILDSDKGKQFPHIMNDVLNLTHGTNKDDPQKVTHHLHSTRKLKKPK